MAKKRSYRRNKKQNAIPSIIPEMIYYNEKISSGAKVFYGMLVFLARPKDYYYNDPKPVYASNKYFYTQMGRNSKYSARAIQYYISELYEQKLIGLEHDGFKREIIPYFLPISDQDIVAFIPPEVVKDNSYSSSKKLTYGLMNYKSGNVNGYYHTNVNELSRLTYRSRATIYRHLSSFRTAKLIRTVSKNGMITIYCMNSYQNSYQIQLRKRQEEEDKIIKENMRVFNSNAPPTDSRTLKWAENFINGPK